MQINRFAHINLAQIRRSLRSLLICYADYTTKGGFREVLNRSSMEEINEFFGKEWRSFY